MLYRLGVGLEIYVWEGTDFLHSRLVWTIGGHSETREVLSKFSRGNSVVIPSFSSLKLSYTPSQGQGPHFRIVQ